MKKFLFFFVFAAALFTFFACVSIDLTGPGRAGRRAARNNEPSGRIVIYTSIYEDVIASLTEALQRQFPNVTIDFVYGGTGQIQSRIASEIAEGRLGADILMVAKPSYAVELKEKRVLHRFKSRYAEDLAFEYDEDGYWHPVRISNMVLAFNPARTDRNSIQRSFYDFAHDPSLRGAVSMSNPLTSGTSKAAITALRDKYGYEFFQALGRQNVVIESGAVALSRLESGERKLVMVLEESVLRKRQEETSGLEVIYPADGTIIIPSPIMIAADRWSANNNIRTAELIVDWFLSPEGQNAIVDGWMHSVRRDFTRSPFDAIPLADIQANSIPFSWENSLRDGDEILAAFEGYVTNRR